MLTSLSLGFGEFWMCALRERVALNSLQEFEGKARKRRRNSHSFPKVPAGAEAQLSLSTGSTPSVSLFRIWLILDVCYVISSWPEFYRRVWKRKNSGRRPRKSSTRTPTCAAKAGGTRSARTSNRCRHRRGRTSQCRRRSRRVGRDQNDVRVPKKIYIKTPLFLELSQETEALVTHPRRRRNPTCSKIGRFNLS